MMALAQIVARNSAAGLGAQVAIKILSFGFSVFVVRHLGAEQFGQYSAVVAFGATFVFLADLGLGAFVVREVARLRLVPNARERTDGLFGDTLRLRLLLASGAAVLLVAAAWATNRPLPMIVAIGLGAVGLVLYGAQGACESVLAGFERLDVVAAAKVANQIAFVLGGAAALYFGLGYHGLVIASLLSTCLLATICWQGVRRLGVRSARATVSDWPKLLRRSAPFAVIAGMLGFSYKFDSVLLNVTRGDAETGFYGAAYNLVFTAAFLSNAVNTALYPTLTRRAISAPARLPEIAGRAWRYLLVIALPIAVGGWALADQIIDLLFGASYAPAAPALAILIWVVPLMFTSELLGYVVVVGGAEGRVARAVMASTGLNVALNLLLIPQFGLIGAALMTLITELLLVMQYVWHLRGTLARANLSYAVVRPLAAAVLMGGLTLALRSQPVLANVAISGSIYGLLLLLLGVLGKEELRFIRGFRSGAEIAVPASPAVSVN
ncbi:MAG: flippase [Chloroflexi bacterium]|nr:flippase [Chloroflexota bacterium]